MYDALWLVLGFEKVIEGAQCTAFLAQPVGFQEFFLVNGETVNECHILHSVHHLSSQSRAVGFSLVVVRRLFGLFHQFEVGVPASLRFVELVIVEIVLGQIAVGLAYLAFGCMFQIGQAFVRFTRLIEAYSVPVVEASVLRIALDEFLESRFGFGVFSCIEQLLGLFLVLG